jgi:hypothetical protein
MYVDLSKHAVGLGGGTIVSGSVNASFTTAFWYYPITATVVNKITFADLVGGNITSASFTAGVGISGTITSVSQSSGIAVVYNALPDFVPNQSGIVAPSGTNS